MSSSTSRLARAGAAAVLAAALLTGCSAPGSPAAVCVPELTVTPSDPHPGRIVTVTTSRACPVDVPEGTTWKVRIKPKDGRIPLAQASVRPGDDGSFQLSISVPPTMPEGPAIVWIVDYWEIADCPDPDGCPEASGRFTVGPNLN